MSSRNATGDEFLRYGRLMRQAAEVWAPEGTYPRKARRHQRDMDSIHALVNSLHAAWGDDGYISTYGFPRGHSQDGNIPRVDTLMLDFDLPGEEYTGDGDFGAWTSEMQDLLARVRLVADYLADEGKARYWRWSLSGHKGVHAYLDFPVVDPAEGDLQQFKNGLAQYTSELVTFLEDAVHVDLDPWLDVDSSDMGRLTRLPNTMHAGATSAFGSDRFCVPVTTNELRDLTTTDYWALTSEPREVPADVRRVESERANESIARYIRHAETGASKTAYTSSYNVERVNEYRDETEGNFASIDQLWLFLEDRPCVKAYFERDGDQFHYGDASHTMELFVMAKLVNLGVPYDLIVEFFRESGADGFDADYTKAQLNEVIARNYNEFNCEKVWADASRFCLKDRCNIYEREH